MITKIDIRADGRQIKQTFTGSYRTTIIDNGITATRSTVPIVKTSGQIIYSVFVDDPKAGPLAILNDTRLPQMGAQYVENGLPVEGVYFSDATPRFIGPRGKFYEWEIVYTVGGEFANAAAAGSDTESGTGEAATTLLTFSTSIELEDYSAAVDLDGNWNTNSIGEFFADPLIYKTGILNIQYQRRETQNPLYLIRDYFQAINNAEIWGMSAGTIKLSDLSFTATQTTEETNYDVVYKLQYRPRGWGIEKANAGLYYLNGGAIVRALNDDGSPTEQPVLLALNGTRLTPGAAVPMKTFRVNPTADFSALGLPNPFEI